MTPQEKAHARATLARVTSGNEQRAEEFFREMWRKIPDDARQRLWEQLLEHWRTKTDTRAGLAMIGFSLMCEMELRSDLEEEVE